MCYSTFEPPVAGWRANIAVFYTWIQAARIGPVLGLTPGNRAIAVRGKRIWRHHRATPSSAAQKLRGIVTAIDHMRFSPTGGDSPIYFGKQFYLPSLPPPHVASCATHQTQSPRPRLSSHGDKGLHSNALRTPPGSDPAEVRAGVAATRRWAIKRPSRVPYM